MSEKSLVGETNEVLKMALSLYVCSGNVLTDGTSFSVKLNNCTLTVSVKDKALTAEFNPNREAAGDTPYELNMDLGLYQDDAEVEATMEVENDDREKAD